MVVILRKGLKEWWPQRIVQVRICTVATISPDQAQKLRTRLHLRSR